MSPVKTVGDVFDAIQRAKAGASGFRTNFFPAQPKLQSWIDHGELLGEVRDGAAFFFRNDRDFRHFYFCAADLPALKKNLAAVSSLRTERIVTDLVGKESGNDELLTSLEAAGFHRRLKLQRMARAGQGGAAKPEVQNAPVVFAEKPEARAVLELIESLFDCVGEQVPALYEIEEAAVNHQIFAVKRAGVLGGILFFEAQGFASAVRFWAVAKNFHAAGVGSALMRHYLGAPGGIRRFTLWVNAANQNAIQKYEHYGYAADGLVDHVLANEMISP
jgi:GNAT superfamily N-acetyltransferase